MAVPQPSITLEIDKDQEFRLKDEIQRSLTNELIIGLCGPIGTDLKLISEKIKSIISERYDYQVYIIKLSDFIKQYTDYNSKSNTNSFERYNNLIQCGNDFRHKNDSSILAELAINRISIIRQQISQDRNKPVTDSIRVCYIIDSIKNTSELELFRLVYSNLFYFFGVFSIISNREKNLLKKGLKQEEIFKLFDRDSGEEIANGQQVSKAFVEADFFLRIDEPIVSLLEKKIERYLHLIFGSEVITPTHNEKAMYQAHAAAGSSACLSRQVGACITNDSGEIIAVGWNDVPKFGGGVYSTIDNVGGDYRCMNLESGYCFNDEEKKKIRMALLDDLIGAGLINKSEETRALEIIKKSRIKELIEFSRAVHAEMLAIIHASQNSGRQVINGSLYCTTYPCHNCARHIVAAGIKEIYYIEPYRKSLALSLHDDSLTENESDTNKVRILMFDGVSPRRYLSFFKMHSTPRKNEEGKKISHDRRNIEPKNTLSLQAIPILEKAVLKDLLSKKVIEAPKE